MLTMYNRNTLPQNSQAYILDMLDEMNRRNISITQKLDNVDAALDNIENQCIAMIHTIQNHTAERNTTNTRPLTKEEQAVKLYTDFLDFNLIRTLETDELLNRQAETIQPSTQRAIPSSTEQTMYRPGN